MYILAFVLLIISITKILIILSTSIKDISNNFPDVDYSITKIFVLILLSDALLGMLCSLYILV